MRIREIMTNQVMTVAPDEGLVNASDIFLWTGIRHLPVVAAGRVVGILSHRDLAAFQAHCGDGSWRHAAVEKAMHSPVETAGPDDAVTEAAARMKEHRIGCLPITEYGRLIGLITTTDILTAHVHEAMRPSNSNGPSVADAMTRDPLVAHPDDRLLDAAARMQKSGIRHLPVVDGEGEVLGLLSDRDIRAAVGNPSNALRAEARQSIANLRVGDAMTPKPTTVEPKQSCSDVAQYFVALRADAAPVVNASGKLVGILSYVDLLRALAAPHGLH